MTEENYIDKFLKYRPLNHIVFWLVIFGTTVLRASAMRRPEAVDYLSYLAFNFYTYLALFPSELICAYLLAYYQIPNFLYRKKYLTFAASVAITLFLGGILARILTVYVAEPLYIENPRQETLPEILTDPVYILLVYVPGIYLSPVLFAAIKLVRDRYRERERVEKLKQEKIKTELKYLKAQIHPHFLLNTLNNLYALTLKKSDKAPETVIKLSEMLVYILYKCDEKLVLLENEIKLLENYISLEKLRYGDSLKISFDKKVADETARIAPLILLSIVENAFKHGVSRETENAEIKIDLELTDDSFTFEVFNTKSESIARNETEDTKGIGVSNVRKQLDLVYENKYTLDVEEKENSYRVFLKLNLKSDK